jgi:adhesin/invasin
LKIGGSETATAKLRVLRRDGAPLTGANVSFVPSLGEMTGTVQDHGDGTYSQVLTPGTIAGPAIMRARVGLVRLDNQVEYRVDPGPADPAHSVVWLAVGPLRLCTGQKEGFGVEVFPVDAHGNELAEATVEIEKASGPALTWTGSVINRGSGRYQRLFAPLTDPGVYEFRAKVDGVALDASAKMDVFAPDSPEGLQLGCSKAPAGGGPSCHGLHWWLLILILIVLLFIVLKRRSSP